MLATHSATALAQNVRPVPAQQPPAAGTADPDGLLAAAQPNTGKPDKSMQLVLPLSRGGRLYGDVLAEVYSDGRVRYDRTSLIERIGPILSENGRAQLEASLPRTEFLTPEEVAQAGITLKYNSSLLEIAVDQIDPAMMAVQSIGEAFRNNPIPVTQQPQDFSAYLNIVSDFRLTDFKEFEDPGVLLFGAARYKGVVLELDGGYDPALTGSSGFYRRQALLSYDEPDKMRRWSAGDLQIGSLSLVSGALLGGASVEKGRRVFTASAPLTQFGGQQVLLDRDATVEVIVDGQQVQTLQLAAGTYDLSQLQAQYGARNAQLYITDVSGRRQLASFDPFFNPADLVAGETEYGAAVGVLPSRFNFQPEYGSDPAFSGYYRRGLSNRLILGGALQLSQDIQVAAAEIIVSPRKIPGRIEVSGAVSTGNSTGFALRGAYVVQLGNGVSGSQFAVNADYRSSGFSTLADSIGLARFRSLNLTASYSQSLSERTTLIAGANLFSREGAPTTRLAYVDVLHRTSRYRLTAGLEYGRDVFGRQFGGRITITIPLDRKTRAEAGYNSRRNDARAFVSRSYDDTVGSFGYDLGVRSTSDDKSVDGIANYVGNRFYSRLAVTTSGNSFGSIDQRQTARLQLGSSIAFAGGDFAIGRPINDSFAIAKPHSSLKNEQVVLGRSVNDEKYEAESGLFGPALSGRLNSYNRQNVIYDLKDGGQGYDIGTGIHVVEPPYRSGYRIVVGTDANVSAYGFLNYPGKRAVLVSGTIAGLDDNDFERQPFFTNSAGRFAVMGLRPGKSYRVTLFNSQSSFNITVPADSGSLLQLGDIAVAAAEQGQE
ncbi:hypothetical protein D3876_03255 [Sphingomonas cavernae]|uniref:Fimbrial biogenesis outer membrane usher protein n=1 Tax=Sphingomonas cavernae TaxID=2320861 RepID=A0A418WQ65_9SPHN|nr:hypothetical protein D3876_03255 [Sphingomonas cavernae]